MHLNSPTTTPVTLLTGYLGAGKTTLLYRILTSFHGLKLAVLVNDFSEINIDSRLIVGAEDDMIVLSNGCICYTMSKDMVKSVTDLLNRDDPPQHIIIEGSGVSDPAQTLLTINRSSLRNYITIDSIVAMVDAEQITAVRGMPEKLVLDQLRVADIAIINKVDLVTEDELSKVRVWVKSIIPDSQIYETSYCDIELARVLGIGSYTPQRAFYRGEHNIHVHRDESVKMHDHSDHSLVYSTWSWTCDEPLHIGALQQVIDSLPSGVFRAKGVLHLDASPDHKVVMDVVGKRVNLSQKDPWYTGKQQTQISLIGEKETFAGDLLQTAFENCRMSRVGQVDVEPTHFVDGELSWIRQEA